MTQRELKARIKEDPNLTQGEKAKRLNELRQPYRALSDEELLQLVRDFTEENGREPMQADSSAAGSGSGARRNSGGRCRQVTPSTTQ